MPAAKIIKIKNNNTIKLKGSHMLMKNNNSSTKGLIDYIQDKNNILRFENLSEDEKQKVYEKYKEQENLDFENLESVNNLINYVSNKNKCFYNDNLLIGAVNCDNKYNAVNEFIELEKNYHKHKIENCGYKTITNEKGEKVKIPIKPNEAFHLINSFKGKDVPPEKCQEIGMEFARRLCGDSFKAVVTTHLNTNNYHNHIAICAYNIDGWHKFRDSWNLGLKIQQISNEIALENGIEIISELANDKLESGKEFNKNFTKIGEYKSNNLLKKQLMADIMLTAKESKDFNEYEKKMNAKGYKLVQQIKSIKYIYDKGIDNKNNKPLQIRDNRLGKQYTKESLEHYFSNKEKNDLIDAMPDKIQINIYKLKPQKFIGTKGNIQRNPLIFQILEFLLKLLEALLFNNENYCKTLPQNKTLMLEPIRKLNTEIKNYKKTILKVQSLMEQYNIYNLNSLKIKKSQLLREYVKHKNQISNKTTTFRAYKKIENAIKNYNELKEFIEKLKLTDSDLFIDYIGDANILESLAKLDPMNSQTKSRLYKAMYNSGYKLKYSFNQITEKQAKEICYFLSEKKKGNNVKVPTTLLTIKEYNEMQKNGTLKEPTKTPNLLNLQQIDLSDFSNEDKQKIKLYKTSKLLLKSYGLNTDSEINDFQKQIDDTKNKYNEIENIANKEKYELKDFNLIEEFLSGNINEKFKPLDLFDDKNIIQQEIDKYVNENESLKEQLITLKTLLNDPYIKPTIDLLDNDTTIIAPAEVLSICKIILACSGKDIDTSELLKMSKKEIKNIITDFINNYNIDEYLKNELNTELNIEKEKINNELKDMIFSVNTTTKDNTKIKEQDQEYDRERQKENEELLKQTDEEQQKTIKNIIDSFTR